VLQCSGLKVAQAEVFVSESVRNQRHFCHADSAAGMRVLDPELPSPACALCGAAIAKALWASDILRAVVMDEAGE
jgi:hypothetical protein